MNHRTTGDIHHTVTRRPETADMAETSTIQTPRTPPALRTLHGRL